MCVPPNEPFRFRSRVIAPIHQRSSRRPLTFRLRLMMAVAMHPPSAEFIGQWHFEYANDDEDDDECLRPLFTTWNKGGKIHILRVSSLFLTFFRVIMSLYILISCNEATRACVCVLWRLPSRNALNHASQSEHNLVGLTATIHTTSQP